MNLTPMHYVRGALLNAEHEGLTVTDLVIMAAHAETPEDFDRAVNVLTLTQPVDEECPAS